MLTIIDQHWGTFLLCGIGVFLIVSTYLANRAGHSGVPVVGGILVAVGFLISPVKWLALLGLADYGVAYLIYLYITDFKRDIEFKKVYRREGYVEGREDRDHKLIVRVPEINEELIRPYITNSAYRYFVPKCWFAICIDRNGRRFLLVDSCRKNEAIKIMPFNGDKIKVDGLKSKNRPMTIELEITIQ